jgi:hypothetical protein
MHALSFVPPPGFAQRPTQFAKLSSHRAAETAPAGVLKKNPTFMMAIAKSRLRCDMFTPSGTDQLIHLAKSAGVRLTGVGATQFGPVQPFCTTSSARPVSSVVAEAELVGTLGVAWQLPPVQATVVRSMLAA